MTPLQRLEARGHWGIKRGLANIRELLAGLGHPETSCRVVLLGGTNGKGSTGAFLAHALRASGHRVGWTTSPHLLGPWERVWVDGASLTADALTRLLERVFAVEQERGLQATYFELMIAVAILAFCEQRVELAVVEVGMGGRWDSTNSLDPILSVVTNVGLDHTRYLGATREAIAREKLCIARHGRPLVLGPSLDARWVWPLLETRPSIHIAPPLQMERLAWDHSIVEGHRVGLAGCHQIENLATALETLRRLADLGVDVNMDATWRSVENAQWPGRLWAVPGLSDVWMDGAHNPDGARVLANHALACEIRPHLLFGAMGDKDIAGMGEALRSINPRSLTLVRGADERYATEEALRNTFGDVPVLNLVEAVDWLRAPSDAPRLVTGSLFLLGDLLRVLGFSI